MSDLDRFADYLRERKRVVADVEKTLAGLQEKYETFFHELERTRESEMAQLRAHLADPAVDVPADLADDLAKAQREAKDAIKEQLAGLEERHAELLTKAAKARQASEKSEAHYRTVNEELDAEEEELKARNESLLTRIADHNRRIRELGSGFGFFLNLFRMRRLAADRRELVAEQADVVARVDALRGRWASADAKRAEKEAAQEKAWVAARTEADAVQTKLDHVRATRARIIERTALERVLFERRPPENRPAKGDPACSRCGQPNPTTNHFCRICALRLRDDRPDLVGSLLELAELNAHHARFADGVRACQELIALLRGVVSGIDAFTNSVNDMKATEKKYPLPKLKIEVPEPAVAWGKIFETLGEKVAAKDASLHPQAFAGDLRAFAEERLNETTIQTWFETMGARLSECADAQW